MFLLLLRQWHKTSEQQFQNVIQHIVLFASFKNKITRVKRPSMSYVGFHVYWKMTFEGIQNKSLLWKRLSSHSEYNMIL